MKSIAYFKDIREKISEEIRQASQSIDLAVAWLTDTDLIRELTKKLAGGVAVTAVICHSEQNYLHPQRFKSFLANGGNLLVCQEVFMHHKFCLIDSAKLINGSYNWSFKARSSEENIIIYTSASTETSSMDLNRQFGIRFTRLLESSRLITDYKLLRLESAALLPETLDPEEQRLIALHHQLEDRIQKSIKISQKLKIDLRYDQLQARIVSDGGGANFIHRIMGEEMTKQEMKPGFNKLIKLDTPRMDLSLEYLVCLPEFAELFTAKEREFCLGIMRSFNLFTQVAD